MRETLLKPPAPNLDFGKLPPQEVEIEKAILSAALIERMAIVEISAIIRSPEYFYQNENVLIYEAILSLYAAGENIDLLTVTERLRKMGHLDAVGGAHAIVQLSNLVGSSSHLSDWCYIVKEKWVLRSIISSSSEAISDAYDPTTDALELLDSFAVKVNNIQSQMVTSDGKTWAMSVQEFDEEMTAPENEGAIPGFSTGYERLDARSLGYQKRHLTLIAGRPGEGKTTLAIQGLRHNAMNGIPVGMVSMEMTKAEILIKLYAMEAGIDTEKMQTKGLTADEWKRYHAAKAVISKWPIYIHDESGMTINQIKSILTMWKLKYGVELAFIDYLQLATVGNDVKRVNNREQEIGYISRTCKAIAMNLDVSVVALSAMSRDIEGRQKSERRPTNSDLRDSGSLEQDANKIIFVYRPEEHGIMQYEDGSSTEGVTEFLLTKARLSSKGTTKAKFEKAFSLFVEPGSYMAVESPNPRQSVQGFKKLDDVQDVPF